MANILIVEDEGIVSLNAEMFLEAEGHTVVEIVNNGHDALQVVESRRPDLVLMDIVLHGELDGIEVTVTINEKFADVSVIYMTAHSDPQTKAKIGKTKNEGILFKPFNMVKLHQYIDKIMKKKNLVET